MGLAAPSKNARFVVSDVWTPADADDGGQSHTNFYFLWILHQHRYFATAETTVESGKRIYQSRIYLQILQMQGEAIIQSFMYHFLWFCQNMEYLLESYYVNMSTPSFVQHLFGDVIVTNVIVFNCLSVFFRNYSHNELMMI